MNTEMGGWGQEDGDRQHRQGKQHCDSQGCLDRPDGSTCRDLSSLVPDPAGTWIALVSARWGGKHTGETARHKKDIGTQ